MRRLILLAVLAGFMSACAAGSTGGKELLGFNAPLTRFTMIDGRYTSLAEFQDKTVVIVFWATWCSKSRRTLGRLNTFAERYKGRDDVMFLAASVDKEIDAGVVSDRIRYTKLQNFKHAFSGNEVYDEAYLAFRGDSLPHIVVISREGKVVGIGNDVDIVFKAFGVDPKSVPEFQDP